MQQKQQTHSLMIIQQPATLALSPQQLPMIQLPLNLDMNLLLEHRRCLPSSVSTNQIGLMTSIKPNQNSIFDIATIDTLWTTYYNKVLDANKLYRFMFYQAISKPKEKGGNG
jgi:hypothetical protein